MTFESDDSKDNIIIISSFDFDQDSYTKVLLIANYAMTMQEKRHECFALIDIDSQVYIAIDEDLTMQICNILDMKSIFLSKSRSIRDFNEELSKRLITYAIYFCLIVNDHRERTYSMLMTKLEAHKIIIEKS